MFGLRTCWLVLLPERNILLRCYPLLSLKIRGISSSPGGGIVSFYQSIVLLLLIFFLCMTPLGRLPRCAPNVVPLVANHPLMTPTSFPLPLASHLAEHKPSPHTTNRASRVATHAPTTPPHNRYSTTIQHHNGGEVGHLYLCAGEGGRLGRAATAPCRRGRSVGKLGGAAPWNRVGKGGRPCVGGAMSSRRGIAC